MSLQQYGQLQEQSQTDLGVQLPTLESADLTIDSKQGSLAEAQQTIAELNPTSGWVMYRDSVEISSIVPDRADLIEGHYSNGDSTVTVRHVYADTYQITTIQANFAITNGDFCCSEQSLCVRQNLRTTEDTVQYRLWYERKDHRWRPLVQQFIGFGKEAR